MQLALQLPADHDEARRVLALTGELLDFLIESQSLPGCAIRLGRRVAARMTAPAQPLLFRLALAIGGLGVSLPLAWVIVLAFGVGGTVALAFCAIAASLLLGVLPGLVLTVLSLVANNLLFVPPAFVFTIPGKMEIVFGCFLLAVVVVAPLLARISPLQKTRSAPPAEQPGNVEPLRLVRG